MKNIHPLIWFFILCFASMTVAFAQVFPNIGAFSSVVDGQVIHGSDWNNAIGTIYTYLNGTLLSPSTGLNVVSQKGDLYVFDGTNLNVQHTGTDGQVLISDSTQPTGLNYTTISGLTTLTTAGDLLGYSASGLTRIPGAASNGLVLTANSSAASGAGIDWEPPPQIPPGTIVAFNQTYGGNIPVGWQLCDGTNNTPNLIGEFIMGSKPSSSGSSANPAGYGYFPAGSFQGAAAHTHTVTVKLPGSVNVPAGTSVQTAAPANPTAQTIVSSVTSIPASYTLVYIMKL